jgi:AcrR family transcriptional regulator
MKVRAREAAAGAILEAAEHVAAERGLENTSIAAIAERAGVAVGTLYNYFPDREALLAAWFQMRRAEMVPKIEEAAAAHPALPFEQRLRAYLGDLMVVFEEKRQFIRVMASIDQKQFRKRDKHPAVLISMLGALQEMVEPVARGKNEVYARMLLGMIRGLAHWRCETGESMSGDADLITDTFLRGVRGG